MTEIGNKIYYIGINDNDIDLFENVYNVPYGISYNSYLIKDEKTTLLDTVDVRKSDEWLKKLDEALEGKELDYLIVSHVEPDHSSNIQAVTEKYPNVTLVGNQMTFKLLSQFFNINENVKKQEVKEGDILDIGEHKLQFFMAPMVHWPEVMCTYEQTEKIIFAADAFGKFGAVDEAKIFQDVEEQWLPEARRYYINIVGKYGTQVQALLKKLSTLDIKMICPLHGPLLNSNLQYYIDKYNTWSTYEPEEKGTLIAVASIHGNTKEAAKKVYDLIKDKENVKYMDLARCDVYEAVAEAFKYDKMVVLASSYNAGVFTPMEEFLNILKTKCYQNRKVGIIENGSWAPSAGMCMRAAFLDMKNITVVSDVVTIKSSMTEENVTQIEQLVDKLLAK